jgi:Transposase IS200 like
MDEYESLSRSKWECKYHVVFIPKCRREVLYGNLRRHLDEVFRKLAEQKECRIEERHLLADHVHMDSSRARARFTWLAYTGNRSRITQGRASGHAVTLYRRSAEMRPRFETTSAIRNRKTSGSISPTYGDNPPPKGGPTQSGPC